MPAPKPTRRLAGFLTAALAVAEPSWAEVPRTDANLVSGLDISESVSGAEMRLQVRGMAEALRSPAFLAAVRSGREGRIGFAVFAWYHGHFPMVVPWRLIASEADAEAAARRIEALADVDVQAQAMARERFYAGRLTNLARAMSHAGEVLGAAPFPSGRGVVNIVGDGADNIGGAVGDARDRLVAAGITVNGVIIGDDADLLDYYRREVAGGDGAFVMAASSPDRVADVMLRKFVQDLIAANATVPAPSLR